jgi:hypothetical protein
MHVFYNQVYDFCELMLAEISTRMNSVPEPPASARDALAFTEKFLLCPTLESARSCIQKDLPGALNFAMALDAANRRIKNGLAVIPVDATEHQTRFYVLGCVVQHHLNSLQR